MTTSNPDKKWNFTCGEVTPDTLLTFKAFLEKVPADAKGSTSCLGARADVDDPA
jgi:hypothetical protein